MQSFAHETLFVQMQMLINRFYMALDMASSAEVANFFVADGEWFRLGERLKGREVIAKVLEGRTPGRRSQHVVSNLCLIAASPERCEIAYVVTVYAGVAEGDEPAQGTVPAAVLVGRDVAVKIGDKWLFASRSSESRYRKA